MFAAGANSLQASSGNDGSAERPIVELHAVNKLYGTNHVVKDLTLAIRPGEFLSLLGPSGCGKTTTLRMIAGFEQQSSGVILVEGEEVEHKQPFERNVNTVFQNYALFPHLTIAENVAFGLKMKRVRRAEIAPRVEEALALVQLEGFGKRYPSQLSGGQKQRIAIARAIINRPRVLLLDEPLGALDLKLRKQMQLELKRLQKRLGITFIYVTHDQEEALAMSDRIAVMHEGVLDQLDIPTHIYEHPQTRFVADFIGESNIFDGVAQAPADKDGILQVLTEAGQVLCHTQDAVTQPKSPDTPGTPGALARGAASIPVHISVRPERIRLTQEPAPGFTLVGTVRENIPVGTLVKSILVLTNGQEVVMSALVGGPIPTPGARLHVSWEPKDAVVLPLEDDDVLNAVSNIDLGGYMERLREVS